ncbi:regulatory protein RecX [Williamsia sp. MIQD14]|uniref:regulatory protein RecX n=1 Tax=Williamsia sp. MIQD14 TaxID=3425703 RepID=UPI003DA1A749
MTWRPRPLTSDRFHDSRTGEDVRARLQGATREILSRSSPAPPPPEKQPAGRGSRSETTAYDSALRLLGVRARSRSELRTRLLGKDFEPAEVDSVLDRLAAVGLVDDADFALQWVRARHEHSGRGRTALRHELRTKGVDPSVAEVALATIDADEERIRAADLVARKVSSWTADMITDREERDRRTRRLVAMLARRGYGSTDAFEIVRAALDDLPGPD